jgi:hypothetical protein
VGTTKRFGQIAVELGFLSPESVDSLLRIQLDSRPKIGEILVEMGKMTAAQLDAALAKYHSESSQR